jgi:hypothetical protein
MARKYRFDWHLLIHSLPDNLSGIEAGATIAQIDHCQETLGVAFEDDYIDFLTHAGFLGCDGVKINGICNTFPDGLDFQEEFDVIRCTLSSRDCYKDEFPERSYIVGCERLVLPTYRIINWPAEPGYVDVGHANFLAWIEWCLDGPWSRLGLHFSTFIDD